MFGVAVEATLSALIALNPLRDEAMKLGPTALTCFARGIWVRAVGEIRTHLRPILAAQHVIGLDSLRCCAHALRLLLHHRTICGLIANS